MWPHALQCAIRALYKTGFTGPILASITALTRLAFLYALPPPCGLLAESGVRMGTLRRRSLLDNRFSGSVPPTISALTALTAMCVPTHGGAPVDAVHASLRAWLRVAFCFRAAAYLTARDQRLVKKRLHRLDPGEHHSAHPAGRAVRPAAARAVSRPTRACV